MQRRDLYITQLWEKGQNCEIKSRNNLFKFFNQWRKRASIQLGPNAQIKYNVTHQTFPILCMCEYWQAIFCNNILNREIARSRKGTSLCMRFANISQRCNLFVFISLSLKITFHCFGLMSWRILYKYSQSWNAVLCNNRRTRSEQQQSSRSEQRKRYSSQKTYK